MQTIMYFHTDLCISFFLSFLLVYQDVWIESDSEVIIVGSVHSYVRLGPL